MFHTSYPRLEPSVAVVLGCVVGTLIAGCSAESTMAVQRTIGSDTTLVLESLLITPGVARIGPGAAQSFATYGVFSDGSTSDTVPVTYSATGGTITPAGEYTAGGDEGEFVVISTHASDFVPALGPPKVFSDTASITVVNAPPPGAPADPTVLPAAAAQFPDVTAWRALGVPTMSVNSSYLDPVTGVRIWRATDATIPTANIRAGHDYGDGGAQVSREWGNGTHTILVRCDGCFPSRFFVDFTRGSGLSNWRPVPASASPCGDQLFSFSNRADSPRIAYSVNCSGVVNRINTASNAVENTGNFPFSGTDSRGWLQTDRTDTWFVKAHGTDGVLAWNSATNQVLTRSAPGLDEPHFEKDGRYVAVITGDGMFVWDLATDRASPVMPRSVAPFFHVASPRGSWVGTNVDLSAPWRLYRLDPTLTAPSPSYILDNSFGTLFHFAGQWIQEDAELGGDLHRQWILASVYNLGSGVTPSTGGSTGVQDSRVLLQGAIGFARVDGGDVRLLAHTYQAYDIGDYWELPRATISPDGKIVIFDSDMLNLTGRPDLFVVEVPLK